MTITANTCKLVEIQPTRRHNACKRANYLIAVFTNKQSDKNKKLAKSINDSKKIITVNWKENNVTVLEIGQQGNWQQLNLTGKIVFAAILLF